MTKFLFAAAAASLALLSTSAIAGERSFTRDGVTYVYTVANKDGARVLEGSASSGGRFRLVVKNGWVRGRVARTPVLFREPRRDAPVQVAQR